MEHVKISLSKNQPKYWKKLSPTEIRSTVFDALDQNVNYINEFALGIPASVLDKEVFNQDASFVKDAPFISTLVQNPNHIGCHTLGDSEHFFAGTHEIEKQLIEICATDILKAKPGTCDGYVAAGGTEANIQAMWVYRNLFIEKHHAKPSEICVLCSEDAHYSIDKAANLMGISLRKFPVGQLDRAIDFEAASKIVKEAKSQGSRHFIVICNMMTTMFGSVDDVDAITGLLEESECNFKLHIDAAFGGFYYPFCQEDSSMSFANPHISSVTLDAHKMAQAPYGTGIFIARKGLIGYTQTGQASYVEGDDCTFSGSRSGANAIAVWMILSTYGPHGWREKIFILQKRADWMCDELEEMGVEFYRHERSNIITVRAEFLSPELAHKFGLVPDNHRNPAWYKIVVMEHVTVDKLQLFVGELRNLQNTLISH